MTVTKGLLSLPPFIVMAILNNKSALQFLHILAIAPRGLAKQDFFLALVNGKWKLREFWWLTTMCRWGNS